jgi:hypothetical protein
MKHRKRCLGLTGLFLGLALPACAARADGLQFDPPAPAAFLFTNGKQLVGRLVSLDADRVICKIDVGVNIFRATRLQAIQTADQTFTFNAQKQEWDSARTVKPSALLEAAKEQAALKDSPRPRSAASPVATEVVISEGIGKTAEEALKDAFRGAVRQVVGAVVDAETLVKNDEIISDKVLTYSDGLIESYRELSSLEDRGLFRKRIAARVVRRGVIARLGEMSLTAKPVAGPDLAASVLTRQEARENAGALLCKALADLPKVLVATPRPTTAADYDEGTRLLRVDISVQADAQRYGAFVQRFTGLLDRISLDKGSVLLEGKPGGDSRLSLEGGPVMVCPNGLALTGPDLNRVARSWCIWVLSCLDRQGTTARWDGYLVDADLRQSVASLRGQLRLHVILLDREGQAITEDEIPLNDPRERRILWAGLPRGVSERNNESRTSLNLLIAPMSFTNPFIPENPFFKFTGQFAYTPATTFHRKIPLTVAELKRFQEIRCEVVFRPDAVTREK